MWFTSSKYKKRWFVIGFNLALIFLGLQFIDLAYATQFFPVDDFEKHLHVLYAMYFAFIAGLLPNYATSIAQELLHLDRRNLKEVAEVFVFFLITLLLNAGVIWVGVIL
jgi:hypothetical protein